MHDRTLAEDYYAAMEHIEKGLNQAEKAEISGQEANLLQARLLELVDRLAEPQASAEMQRELLEEMRQVLGGGKIPEPASVRSPALL